MNLLSDILVTFLLMLLKIELKPNRKLFHSSRTTGTQEDFIEKEQVVFTKYVLLPYPPVEKSEFKRTTIIAIFKKKGKLDDAVWCDVRSETYSPIAFLNGAYKQLERLLYNRLTPFIMKFLAFGQAELRLKPNDNDSQQRVINSFILICLERGLNM